MLPLETRHKMSLATISDPPSTDAEYDVGDPQFWIDRRVACITGQYPPNEADFVSIQEYVLYLEAFEKLASEQASKIVALEIERAAHRKLISWLERQIRNHELARADADLGRVKAERDTLRALLKALREEIHCADIGDWNLLDRIDAALKEKP